MEKLNEEIVKRCGNIDKFCNDIGISKTLFYNIQNKGRATKKTLEKIAEGLDIDYESIKEYIPTVYEKVEIQSKLKSKGLNKEEISALRTQKKAIKEKIIKEHKSSKCIYLRKKLKTKIQNDYGSTLEFSKASGIPSQTVLLLCKGKVTGTYESWIKIQDVLKLPDEEMWSYYKKEGN